MKPTVTTLLLSAAVIAFCHPSAHALDAFTPPGLEVFSRMNVHSIVQDRKGAMWISTTRGLFRYNGHSLEHLSDEIPWDCLSYDGSDTVLALTSENVLAFDINTFGCVASGHAGSRPVKTDFRCSDGTLATALEDGGFSVGDRIYKECGSISISAVRGFAQTPDGTLYAGSASGLYSLDNDGVLRSESIAGTYGCPVRCMYQTDAGDIWIGTYRNGVFLASRDHPFDSIEGVPHSLMINGITDTPDGIFLFTDGQGVWRIRDGACTVMPAFGKHKFQGVFYDETTGLVWTTVFNRGLIAFDLSGEVRRTAPFSGVAIESLTPIRKSGGDLLIGTSHGLYRFDPGHETVASRREPGIDGLVYSMKEDDEGRLWIVGDGIHVISQGTVSDVGAEYGRDLCYGVDFAGPSVWLSYARKGVRCILPDGSFESYTASGSGLCDDFTYGITALPDSSVLVNTASGISIIDPRGSIRNYRSIKADCVICSGGSRFLLFGRDGAWSYSPGRGAAAESGNVRIDNVLVGGKRFPGSTMPHDGNNIAFDVTCFTYGESSPLTYYCRMDGLDGDWSRFRLQDAIQYRNLRPGRYTFRVKACNGDVLQSEDSFSFRIKPVWYASPVAVVCSVFLLLGLASLILYFVFSRRRLASALAKKEEESREKTRFFTDLSLGMRTPLNLIIGKLERYFRDYGSRAVGSENIEDIYRQSCGLRNMIGEFVDVTCDSAIEPDVSGKVLHDARFHNAAIGAVERNLYSPDLDIALLCKELNVGKTTLTARLKQTSGMTPRAFIEDIRLTHAAQMLEDGSHRIVEISDLLCFCSSKYFCSRFRTKYGCTPSEFRKNLNNHGSATASGRAE